MQDSLRGLGVLGCTLSALAFVSACRSTPSESAARDARASVGRLPSSPLVVPAPNEPAYRSNAKRSTESFRKLLPASASPELLQGVPAPLLDEVRTALDAKDLPRAAEAVVALLRAFPKSMEAREALVCVQFLQRNPEGALRALEELRTIAPRSPLLLALDGLDAQRRGKYSDAAENLAWFVGTSSLPLTTALGALPVESGRVHEALMNALLALGAFDAAEDVAEELLALSAQHATDASLHQVAMRARILIGDLAQSRGNRQGAMEAWGAVASLDGFEAEIARWRLASCVVLDASRADEECLRILGDPAALLRDEPALLRIASIASVVRPSGSLPLASARAEALAADLPEDLRLQCIAARFGSESARARVRGQASRAWRTDPFAYRLAIAGAALESATDAIDIARLSVAHNPASLRVAAEALSWSGLRIHSMQSVLESATDDPSRMLWSALLCAVGLPEDGAAVARAFSQHAPATALIQAAQIVAAGYLRDASLVDEARRVLDRDAFQADLLAELTLEAERSSLDPLASIRTADRAAQALAASEDESRRARRKEFLVESARGRLETGSAGKVDRELLRAEILSGGVGAEGAWVALAAARGDSRDDCPPPPSIAMHALLAAEALAASGSPLVPELLALACECSSERGALARLQARASAGDAWSTKTLARLSEQHPADALVGRGVGERFSTPLDALEERRALRMRSGADPSLFPRPQTPALEMLSAELAHAASDDAIALTHLKAALVPASTLDSLLVRAFALLIEISAVESANASLAQPLLETVVERLLASAEDLTPLVAVALYDTKSESGTDAVDMRALAMSLSPRVTLGTQGAAQSFLLTGRLLARFEPEFAAMFAHALSEQAIMEPAIRALVARHATALDALSGGREAETIHGLRTVRALGVEPYLRESEITAGVVITEAESVHRASGTYSLLGNDAGAAALTLEALRLDQSHAGSLNNLAYAALDRGVWGIECEQAAIRAAQLAPDNASFLDTLGLLRYRKGELQDGASGQGAITLFRTALRLAPRDPSITTLLHLGDALWLSGDQAGAIKCWQQIAQVAALRYPPREIAQSLTLLQHTQFGMQFLDPDEFLSREYGKTVMESEHRLQAVARGATPAIGASEANPISEVQVGESH